jgi:hypothetical protein
MTFFRGPLNRPRGCSRRSEQDVVIRASNSGVELASWNVCCADSNAENRNVGELVLHQRMMREAVDHGRSKGVWVQLQLDRNVILKFCEFSHRWRQK